MRSATTYRSASTLVVVVVAVIACGRGDPPAPQPSPAPSPPSPAQQSLADAAIVSDYRDARVEPAITGVSPELGPAGQWVYVTGRGFTKDATVELGPIPAKRVAVYGDDQLGFTVPSGAVGVQPVHVTIGALRLTSTQRFTIGIPSGRPALTSFAPKEGAPGAYIFVYGANFVHGDTTVLLGDAHVPAHIYSPDTLGFTVPAAAHDAPLIVRTPNGDAHSDGRFRVLAVRRADAVR